jgi:hypothetical protein
MFRIWLVHNLQNDVSYICEWLLMESEMVYFSLPERAYGIGCISDPENIAIRMEE